MARAFLRWVGGKRLLVSRLLPFVPNDAAHRFYREPFLGAASMFFALAPKRARLSDSNRDLIRVFRQIKEDPSKIAEELDCLAAKHNPEHYYSVRDLYNSAGPTDQSAARFMYLNATCFNGVFRVNRRGEFNVPVGKQKRPRFLTSQELAQASAALRSASVATEDYKLALLRARKGDFVYLDPPYPALNGTSFFAHYTRDRFNTSDHLELLDLMNEVGERGVLLMMTNADTPEIRKLYGRYQITPLSVTRYVSCKGRRHSVGELVITNYEVSR